MRIPCRPSLACAALAGLLSLALAACSPDPTSTPDAGPGATSTFTVGGTVSGLAAGAHVVLKNAAETLSVTQDGAFSFTQKVEEGTAYAVTVQQQPAGATCSVQNASGTLHGANVTSVAVTCSADTYAVGGSVSGLVGGSSLELQLNGGELLTVSADGAFTFAGPVADLGGYAVSVKTQPVGHTCSVAHGEGTLAGAPVTDVAVTCEAQRFTVRGSLLGLSAGQSVVLKNNGGDALTVTGNGLFTFSAPVAFGSPYAVTTEAAYPIACSVLRGAGTMGAQAVTNVSISCSTTRFAVGGSVSGLMQGGVLQLKNGAETLFVNANGPFTFLQQVPDLGRYEVTVSGQPIGHSCSVTQGTGTLSGAPVTSVAVLCVRRAYSVGGTVTGLGAGQSVVLKNNGQDALTFTADGPFTFPTPVLFRSDYAVTAEATYPLVCSVLNGSATMMDGDVTDVVVSCSTTRFTVGGTVTGLAPGTALELQNNGGDALGVSADGPFTFAQPVVDLGAYDVAVRTQPTGQHCAVTNGAGQLAGAKVTGVAITCAPLTYAVRGTVTGLGAGQSLVLRNNGADALTVGAEGPFAFPAPVAFGSPYAVTVEAAPPLVCSVANAAGSMGAADVTDVAVLCSTTSYAVGGAVAGLAAGATLELQLNGDEVLVVSGDGAFTFTRPVADLAAYAVTVRTQPAGQRCSVQNGAGVLGGAPVTDIAVSCADVYRVRVSVAGLTDALALQNGADTLRVGADGTYAFAQGLLPGEPYDVTVSSQPRGQTCEVTAGAGTMGSAEATVAVSCTPNVVVVHAGTSLTFLGTGATAVVLEEYRPTGALVRSIPVPATGGPGADRLTIAGVDINQGHLSRSGNGRLLTLAGFDADVGTASLASTAAAQTPRVVGQVDLAGSFSIAARVNDAYTAIRSATTVDGSRYWLSGQGGGIRSALPGSTPTASTEVSTGLTDTRTVGNAAGRLYFSLGIPPSPNPGAYAQGVLTFPSAQPTAAETPLQLPGFALSLNSSGFALVDLNPAVPGLDTAYVSVNVSQQAIQGGTPDTLRLEKWTFDGTTWSKVASFVPAFVVPGTTTNRIATNGVAAVQTPRGVRVYATTHATGSGGPANALVTFVDDGSTDTPATTVLATAPANTAFRGVAPSPLP